MEAANARNLGMPPADQPMQLSLPPAELTSSQLRELGKSQSSRAGAWEALKFVGLGFIATRHFTNKAVMHIRSENMRHITATFGLSETSAKALAKTSTAKRTILTDTHKTYIKSDADKLQVLEAVRKPNHWARGIFSAGDQKTFDSLTPEKALKPDEMVVATHLITQWDELNRLSKEVSPEVFKQLLAAAGAFESNVQPELTAKLNDLVSLYNALPQDTPDRVATAIEVNKIINEASAQQEYAHIGEAGNFRAFVTEKIKTSDDGLQAVQNREQPIERAFNLVSYGKDIVEGVGRELADKICSQVLGANVTTGAVHYKLSPNYENVKSELESIVTMKNQCESCGIGAAFPILLEKALGEIEVEESPDALSALKGKLGAHFKPLRLLVAVKEEYDKAGRTESYNASIAQKVAAFQTDPTASGLESIAQEMRLAYFADQANVAVEKLGQRFGLQLAAVARQEFDRVLVGQQSGEQFVEIHGKLLDAATNLEDARVRFVREEGLTDNDFKQVLDGLLRADPPKVTLEGLSRKDGQQMHHLSAACRLHSTEKSKQEWLQEYGTELRPYLDQVLASKGYEGVADGSLSLKNSTWMEAAQGWTLEETQMWSVATAVQVSNRAVPPLEIRDILLSTDLTVQ